MLKAKKIRTGGLALSDDTFYSYRTGWLIQISQSKTSPYLTVLCFMEKNLPSQQDDNAFCQVQ